MHTYVLFCCRNVNSAQKCWTQLTTADGTVAFKCSRKGLRVEKKSKQMSKQTAGFAGGKCASEHVFNAAVTCSANDLTLFKEDTAAFIPSFAKYGALQSTTRYCSDGDVCDTTASPTFKWYAPSANWLLQAERIHTIWLIWPAKTRGMTHSAIPDSVLRNVSKRSGGE